MRAVHHWDELSQGTRASPAEGRAPASTYRILVRDLVLPWRIGVRQHEEDRRQRVRINLDLIVHEQPDPTADNYHDVTCYERIIERIRQMAAAGHVKLAETVAHNIATMCLSEPNAVEVTVRVEKLEAIHDAASVGVEITRFRDDPGVSGTPGRLKITE